MNAEDAGLPVRPLTEIIRQAARQDLRDFIATRDGTQDKQEQDQLAEQAARQGDRWLGARFIVHNGRRVFATHGQQLRMAEA